MDSRCKQEGVFSDGMKAVFKEASVCSAHGHEIRRGSKYFSKPFSGKKSHFKLHLIKELINTRHIKTQNTHNGNHHKKQLQFNVILVPLL